MEYTRLQERILLESIVISRYRNTSWDGIRVDFSSDKLPGFFTTPIISGMVADVGFWLPSGYD